MMMTDAHDAIALPSPDHSATPRQHAWAILAIVALTAVLGYFDLGRRDLTNSLEVGYALSVQEMVRNGDWLVPRLNERPRLVKPPLPFWVGAAAAELTTGDAAPMPTLRAVAAGMGALAAVCVYFLGVSMFDRRAGLWAGLAWATMFLAFLEYRYARHDIFLTAAVALAMLGIWRAWAKQRGGWPLAALGLILAFQVKGPVSWALVVLPAVVFAIAHRPIRWRFIGGVLLWALTAGLSLLPWVIAVQQAAGVDFRAQYEWEAIGRFTSAIAPYQPPWYYLQYVAYVLPWTAYLIAGLVVPFERKYAARGRALRFAWVWLVVGLAFMTLPREKTSRYAAPLLAPGALLIGQIIAFHLALWREKRRDPAAGALWIGHTLTLAGVAIVTVVVAVRMAHPLALILGVAMVVVTAGVGMYFRRNRIRQAMVLSVAFAGLALFSFALLQQLPPHNTEPNRALADKVVEVVGDAPIVGWPADPHHALAYYTNRSMPAVANRFLVHEYLPNVEREDLRDRWRDPNTRAADQAAALGNWLDQQPGEVAYIVASTPRLDELLALAEQRGARARVVMDLTTVRPHTGEPGEPFKLVRWTRREQDDSRAF